MTIRTIGVVVPAHDEEALIARCIRSIDAAAAAIASTVRRVDVFVVCDACTDRTVDIVRATGHTALLSDARNVGKARAIGAAAALARGADWLAFTDADTTVCRDWLAAQVALRATWCAARSPSTTGTPTATRCASTSSGPTRRGRAPAHPWREPRHLRARLSRRGRLRASGQPRGRRDRRGARGGRGAHRVERGAARDDQRAGDVPRQCGVRRHAGQVAAAAGMLLNPADGVAS